MDKRSVQTRPVEEQRLRLGLRAFEIARQTAPAA